MREINVGSERSMTNTIAETPYHRAVLIAVSNIRIQTLLSIIKCWRLKSYQRRLPFKYRRFVYTFRYRNCRAAGLLGQ